MAVDLTTTYGINFPFQDSTTGQYLQMTTASEIEVRSNLIHLILTEKGSRYFYLILEQEFIVIYSNQMIQ